MTDETIKVAPKPPSLMQLSTALSPWTHIRQIRLVESSVKSKIEGQPGAVQLEHTFDATTLVDRDNKALTVRAHLTISAGDVLVVEADFLLDYSVDDQGLAIIASSEPMAAAFGKINGIFNTWPYWREYVQSSATRAGLPPLTIPLMTGASVLAYYEAKALHACPQVAQQQQESGPRLGGAADL